MVDLKKELHQKATGEELSKSPIETVQEWLVKLTPEFQKALPKHVTVDRLLRLALTTIKMTPKLLECNLSSLMGAIMQACVLGLEINNPLGHCYILPFWNSKLAKYQATFILGYQGLADLVWRTNRITSMQARAVYEGDYFRYEFGKHEFLSHKPSNIFDPKKPITHFYAYVTTKEGAFHAEVFVKAKVDWWKQTFSPSANTSFSPWNNPNTYPMMGQKTVLKQCCKLLPKSIELSNALNNDEIVKADPLLLTDIINPEHGFLDLPNEDVDIADENKKLDKKNQKSNDIEKEKKKTTRDNPPTQEKLL